MKKYFLIFLLTITLSSSLSCGLFVKGAYMLLQGGVVSAVTGKVTLLNRKGKRVRLTNGNILSIDGIMLPGTKLITGKKSYVDLQFTEYIKLRVGPRSSLRLDLAKILESKDFSKIKMNLMKGSMFGEISKKLKKHSSFLVAAGKMLSSVKGTQFMIRADGKKNSLLVKKGSVVCKNINSGNDVVIDDKSKGTLQGTVIKKEKITDDELSQINSLGDDIETLSASQKKKIKEIVETNKEQQRLIKEAVAEHKRLFKENVSKQRKADKKRVDTQKETDKANVDNVKGSVSDQIKDLKTLKK